MPYNVRTFRAHQIETNGYTKNKYSFYSHMHLCGATHCIEMHALVSMPKEKNNRYAFEWNKSWIWAQDISHFCRATQNCNQSSSEAMQGQVIYDGKITVSTYTHSQINWSITFNLFHYFRKFGRTFIVISKFVSHCFVCGLPKIQIYTITRTMWSEIW